jgi:hypothetical protein
MNNDQQYARVASQVADRVNQAFHGAYGGPARDGLATAKTKTHVVLQVPTPYRHNLPRYLRVVRLVPLAEEPRTEKDSEGKPRKPYRQQLAEDLLNPQHCVSAALRLEALGNDSIPALKEGLKSTHALVRFCAAEALAYLGSPSCGEVLAQMVQEQPALRAFSLTALASLDEAVCHVKLRDLLASPEPETRYGAFRALRALDERDAAVQGDLLNNAFWLHRVAGQTEPLVHLASSKRAEIVLFGQPIHLKPPFSFLAGEFAITAGDADERCTISRFSTHLGNGRKQCSLALEDVLRTLAAEGGTYPDAVELLRQAADCLCLTGRVMVDALPQATSVHELARAGRGGRDGEAALLRPDREIVKSRLDFGTTPNLFQKGTSRRFPASAHDGAEGGSRPRDERRTAERPDRLQE